MNTVINKIRKDLNELADPLIQQSAKRFFKESLQCYGIKTPEVKFIAKEYYKEIKELSKLHKFELCENLWQSGYFEEAIIAANWTYFMRKSMVENDFAILENWIENYVSNWATCDTFCNHTIGDFLIQFPATVSRLKQWTYSQNRWMKRAAAVSLIVPAGKGLFLTDVFEIASLLMNDRDDLVQKGYGWMLKVASKKHLYEVYDFVLKNKLKMPRTALRYAIEKMPDELKKEAMVK